MKILKSCFMVVLVITAAVMVFSSCGRNGKMTSIAVLPENISMIPGTSQQFQAQGHLSDGTTYFLATVNWSLMSTAGTASVTIDPTLGLAVASDLTPTGSFVITAADPYSTFTGTTTLTVSLLSSITVTPNLPSMTPGLTHQFSATGNLANGATQDLTSFVTWTTDNPAIATIVSTPGVAGTGIVTSVATGTAVIQASLLTSDGTGTKKTVIGATTLAVTPVPLASLAIPQSQQNQTINMASTQQFSATGTYSAGTPPLPSLDWTFRAIWSSSNTAVATINAYDPAAAVAAGATTITVTAVAPGTTVITATDPITGIAASTTLTVATPPSSIAVTPVLPSMISGSTYSFTATGTYDNAATEDLTSLVTWTSLNPAVATVAPAGIVTSVGTGTTIIQATDPASGVTGTAMLLVTAVPLATLAIMPANPSIAAGATQQFTAGGTYSDGTTRDWTLSAIWSSSNQAVATVNNAGVAAAVAPGTTVITAIDPITGITARATLTVTATATSP